MSRNGSLTLSRYGTPPASTRPQRMTTWAHRSHPRAGPSHGLRGQAPQPPVVYFYAACAFRCKAASDSDLIRPPIPTQSGQSDWRCDRPRWVIVTGATFAPFERSEDASGEIAHAQNIRRSTAARRRIVEAADCRQLEHRPHGGRRLHQPRAPRGSGLAAARGVFGRGSGTAAVPAAASGFSRSPAASRLACAAPRTQAARRHPVAAVGGVPRRSPRWLRLQPVLRTLPRLEGRARPDHAPGPCRRREAVRRLCRRHDGGDRRP